MSFWRKYLHAALLALARPSYRLYAPKLGKAN